MRRTRQRNGRRALRLLSSRSAPWLAVGLGLLLAAPGLFSGFVNDDFLHRLILEGQFPNVTFGPLGLYDFTGEPTHTRPMVEHGFLLWFTEPELRLRFFRPLASLSLALDQALFGREALPAHVTSWLWLAVLLSAAAALFRRVLRPAEASLATLIYAVSNAHDVTTVWLAARHSVLGGAFAVLAITLHVSAREERSRWRGASSLGALALGLLSSETALGAVVFIVLYEVLASSGPRHRRALFTLPAVALASAHLSHYVLAHYGAHGAATYTSPFDDPLAFAWLAVQRLPVLAADAFGGLPSMAYGAVPEARPVTTAIGLVLGAVVAALLFAVETRTRPPERRRHRWLFVATFAALVPMLGGFLGGRLLVVAGLGAAASLAVAIVQVTLATATHERRRLLGAAVIGLLALNLGFAPLVRLGMVATFASTAERQRALAQDFGTEACPGAHTLLLVNASDPTFSMYFGPLLAFHRPALTDQVHTVTSLSMAPVDHRLSRLDASTIELTWLGERRVSDFERTFRGSAMTEGETVRTNAFEAEVMAVEGGRPTRVRFSLTEPQRVCLGIWDGAELVSEPLPEVGGARELPFIPGPMSM